MSSTEICARSSEAMSACAVFDVLVSETSSSESEDSGESGMGEVEVGFVGRARARRVEDGGGVWGEGVMLKSDGGNFAAEKVSGGDGRG